ncbi:MAG: ribosome maturation factor RimM [Eubacteriaceae bacterium]
MKNEMITIGRITGCHGLRGELKVLPLTDDPQRFSDLKQVEIKVGEKWERYAIDSVRYHKNNVLIFLKACKNRSDAETLVGKYIEIPRDLAVPLEDDEFFVEDLLGMSVYNNGTMLGKIIDILQTGGVDVFTIQGDNKIYSIPGRKVYFQSFDFENNRIDGVFPDEILGL